MTCPTFTWNDDDPTEGYWRAQWEGYSLQASKHGEWVTTRAESLWKLVGGDPTQLSWKDADFGWACPTFD